MAQARTRGWWRSMSVSSDESQMQTSGPRLSRQMQQEDRSVGQLMDHLAAYGWAVNPIRRDVGEDLLIQIFANGAPTGLSFYVQLKSVTDIEDGLARPGGLTFQVDVKHLKHWEVSAVPVCLLVWDVGRRYGRWQTVPEAIAGLDKQTPAWRNQKTIRVVFPASNTTDDAGLLRLQRAVAIRFLPVISAGKTLDFDIQLQFPPSEEGRTKLQEFQRCMSAGDPVEIPGHFIRALKPSAWWTRLFGDIDPADWHLGLGSVATQETFPWRLDVVSKTSLLASVHYLEMRMLKRGSEEITLSNEAQPIPVSARAVFRLPNGEFRISLTVGKGITAVDQVYEALSFLCALNVGDTLRVTALKDQVTFDLPLGQPFPGAPNSILMELLRKVVEIQAATGCKLAMPPEWSPTRADARAISEVGQIIQTGHVDRQDQIMRGKFKKPVVDLILVALRAGQSLQFRFTNCESWAELLGTKVDLGPSIRYVNGHSSMSVEELQSAASAMGPDDELPLSIVRAQVTDQYDRWPSGSVADSRKLPPGGLAGADS